MTEGVAAWHGLPERLPRSRRPPKRPAGNGEWSHELGRLVGGASPEKLETFGESTPMGRPGQPNEVAPSFLFLACEDSSYMSGQVLHPNGGTIVNG